MASLRQWLPLVVALTLNAGANVLLKLGAQAGARAADDGSAVSKVMAFLNGVTLLAMVLFGANVIVYRKALERVPLSIGYPVMISGSLVLAVLGARLVPQLSERISPVQLAGMGVIMLGVWMVAR